MNTDEVISLGAAIALAVTVRFFNIVLKWLAKALKVEEESPVSYIPGMGLPDTLHPT